MTSRIHLALVVAGESRPETAIESLWSSARAAVPAQVELTCTAFVATASELASATTGALTVSPLNVSTGGAASRAAAALSAKGGPAGVAGRLLEYNLASHRVVWALRKDKALTTALCSADIVVSADPQADWAVWSLRNKTAAPLIHGPFAMANALSEMARA